MPPACTRWAAFVGDSWKEWNGRFRDDVRDFFRGAENSVTHFADRFVGSPQIYGHEEREAEQSVNFVTCHDGFTLNDLVSYNEKHNEENGEDNRDGANDNRSWNCGVEGPSEDPVVEQLRNRQVKNFLTVTMLSLGVPMIVMGDEVRRSQGGNNNAYCLDNETSWFDWTLLSKHADVHRFARLLIARRLQRDVEHERRRVSLNELIRNSTHAWHGVNLGQPDWGPNSHCVAFGAELRQEGLRLHLIFNAFWEPLDFELPPLSGHGDCWRLWIDTALDPPREIVEWQAAQPVSGPAYRAGPRSVVALIAARISEMTPSCEFLIQNRSDRKNAFESDAGRMTTNSASRATTMTGLQIALTSFALFGGMLCLTAAGRWIGRIRINRKTEDESFAVLEGGVFGLMGLLIALTFSVSASRLEARRQMVVDEANAIGTAWLRIALLPEARQGAMRQHFRQYVDTRLAFHRDVADFDAATRALMLHQQLAR